MKFRVEHDMLADAVAWVARALPTRPVVPILSSMRLDAEEDGLTLSCFDYELSATAHLPADVAEPGTALVPGRLLAEITRSLPGQPAEFHSAGDEVTLTCGSAEFALVSLPTAEYPALPQARVTSSPSERNSAGCPGRLRVISASRRPGTSAVPACTTSAGTCAVADSS